MTGAGAALAGYLIGSVPTAVWLGRLWGVDLLGDGSGNPGANNARRLGGYTLAVLILIIEIGKGLAAVVVGLVIGGESAALAAGVGAVAGNVYNVWHRFKGGKGLGISGGVILGLWPSVFPFVVVTLAVASALTRSTGIGSFVTLVA
ncbi:MAG: glycerol-3-phosphate acyltransferase, partial [Acidimicrobiia bacterium]